MNRLDLSDHAVVRTAQRAIARDDLDVIRRLGTEVEGGFILREKDYEDFAHQQKYLCERIRRLVGTRVVTDGDTVITAYKATKNKRRRLLRSAEE